VIIGVMLIAIFVAYACYILRVVCRNQYAQAVLLAQLVETLVKIEKRIPND
jgi:hypothetical protein